MDPGLVSKLLPGLLDPPPKTNRAAYLIQRWVTPISISITAFSGRSTNR
jgi:hypothetical protein